MAGNSIESAHLPNELRALSTQQRTGSLTLKREDGRLKHVYFNDGRVDFLYASDSENLLLKTLVKTRMVAPAVLKALLDERKQRDSLIRPILVEKSLASPQKLRDAMVLQVEEELFDSMGWDRIIIEFSEGEAGRPFDHETLTFPLRIPVDSLIDALSRKGQDWEEQKRTLPSLWDVYKQTAKATLYLHDENNPFYADVLPFVDGIKDLEEVIADAASDRFTSMRALKGLAEAKAIEPIPAARLLELGGTLAKEKLHSAALKRYLRAEQLGAEFFDLDQRIGECHRELGEKPQAANRYTEYAGKCYSLGRLEDAAASLRQVLELEPGDAVTAEMLIRVYQEQGKLREAAAEYQRLAGIHRKDKEWARERAAILNMLKLLPGDEAALRQAAEAYRAAGELTQAVIDLEEQSTGLLGQRRLKAAVTVLQTILELDEGCVEARLQLATTLAEMGDPKAAVAQYEKLTAVLASSGVGGEADKRSLIGVHEKIVELDPENQQAREWLASAYAEQAETDKALGQLRRIAESQRKNQRTDALALTLKKIAGLDPADVEVRIELAEIYLKQKNKDQAIRELIVLADHAFRNHDLPGSRRYLEKVLGIAPFHLKALKGIAEVYRIEQDKEATASWLRKVAILTHTAGMAEDALEAAHSLLEIAPQDPLPHRIMAELDFANQKRDVACEAFLDAARFELARDNLGAAAEDLKRAAEADAGNAEIEVLRQELSEKKLRMDTPRKVFVPEPAPAPIPAPAISAETPKPEPASQTTQLSITAHTATPPPARPSIIVAMSRKPSSAPSVQIVGPRKTAPEAGHPDPKDANVRRVNTSIAAISEKLKSLKADSHIPAIDVPPERNLRRVGHDALVSASNKLKKLRERPKKR